MQVNRFKKRGEALGIALDQLVSELDFKSLNELWVRAGQRSSRSNWYKRLNGTMPIAKVHIDKLIQGLREHGNTLYPEQIDLLYRSIDASNVEPLKDVDVSEMPWESYRRKVLDISHRLVDKSFTPDAILGISNGGMIFADMLVYSTAPYKHKMPVWTLWANRDHRQRETLFDNIPNNELISGLIQWLKQKKIEKRDRSEVVVLLVDDIIATGVTSVKAIEYLRRKTQDRDIEIRFLPLFNKNHKFDAIRDFLIWKFDPFNYTDTDIQNLHSTHYNRLPYLKELR